MRAGIVEVAGPECRFRGEETTGKFNVESPHVEDSLHEATWLVEAHSPDPQLPRNTSPLYIQMREDGLVAEHLNPSAGGDAPDRQSGGLNVSDAPYRVIDAERRDARGPVRARDPDRAHELVHPGGQRQAGSEVGVHARRSVDRRGRRSSSCSGPRSRAT